MHTCAEVEPDECQGFPFSLSNQPYPTCLHPISSNLPAISAISFSVTYPCCVLLDLTQYLYPISFPYVVNYKSTFSGTFISFIWSTCRAATVCRKQFAHCGLRLAEKIWFAHMATTCKAWRSGFFVTEWTLLFHRALSRLVCTWFSGSFRRARPTHFVAIQLKSREIQRCVLLPQLLHL